MKQRSGVFGSPFVRLTLYYVALGLIIWGLAWLFPSVRDAFSGERLSELAQRSFFGGGDPVGVGDDASMRGPIDSLLFTLFALVGCVVLLIPVVWVYMLTRQARGYDESVVHTVIILPVAVTALVIVVQDSIALAFSLAGIVAAVRFRNTLKDTKDAVFIFLAIGTALAAGVQALGIAAVSTAFFNYLALVMWRHRIGDIYADQLSRTPRMGIGDVLAGAGTPGAGVGNLTIGSSDLLAALTPDSIEEIAERRERLRQQVEGAGKAAKKFSGLLVVVTQNPDECYETIEKVIEDATEKCTAAGMEREEDGTATIEFLVGLAKDTEGSDLIATLRRLTGRCVLAAQYRDVKIDKVKDGASKYWTLE